MFFVAETMLIFSCWQGVNYVCPSENIHSLASCLYCLSTASVKLLPLWPGPALLLVLCLQEKDLN